MVENTNKEILETIIKLSIEFPNDSELGKHIRLFLNDIEKPDNQSHK